MRREREREALALCQAPFLMSPPPPPLSNAGSFPQNHKRLTARCGQPSAVPRFSSKDPPVHVAVLPDVDAQPARPRLPAPPTAPGQPDGQLHPAWRRMRRGRRKRYQPIRRISIAKDDSDDGGTYLKDLEWFRSAVIRRTRCPEGLKTLLFSNIDPIYEFHRGFLREEFTGFLQKHDEVLTELEKASRRLKKLEAVYKEFELQKVCYLPLNTFLLKPVQRLMHYKLILERLSRHYPPEHPDHHDCSEALKEVAEIAAQLQSSLIRLENFQKLTELQRDLVGVENLTSPGRVSVMTGRRHKRALKNRGRHLYLTG
ncbi:hypothetical protein CRUP_002222 [Coryphaenoides rupestris]|nr:hypothetical protein CRUP_002222 [Coryphaenoides rupestris]